MKHPQFEKLLNKFEGSLSGNELQEIAEHLTACAECRIQAEKIKNFVEYSETFTFESVPHNATANLLNIFQPLRSAPKRENRVRRLLANLVFDDWQTALNERFVYSDSRQMLFKAGNYEIDLRLKFTGEKCQLSGQIFPDCSGGTVEIAQESHTETTAFNESCEFTFSGLDHGVYQLKIEIGESSIDIKDFSLVP